MPTQRPRLRKTNMRKDPVGSAITIHQVAALAQVSGMTVSRALKTPDRVSTETLQRVRDAVARTGYVPNALAGGLKSARTGLVAALVPALRAHIYDVTIEALTDTLAAAGYQLLLGQTGHSPEREEELLRALVGRRPEGIVLTGVRHSKGSRSMLMASGLPVVETNDWTSAPIDMLVGFSHERIGRDACRYLAAKGHKRLAVIGSENDRARQRADAFLAAARELRLPAPKVHVLSQISSHSAGRGALADLLAAGKLDAAYCSSDLVALGVLTEARVRGIRVPSALAVLGSGDMEFAASVSPSLSTLRVDFARIGTLAARFIIDRVERRATADTVVDVGSTIVERESA
jgi:LacI family gluconate utilization system Gnt-I transcriptional repressor